jgi:hypothetical protein
LALSQHNGEVDNNGEADGLHKTDDYSQADCSHKADDYSQAVIQIFNYHVCKKTCKPVMVE